MKIQYHITKILEDVNELEADEKTAKLIPTAYKNWEKDARLKLERYKEDKLRERFSRLNE